MSDVEQIKKMRGVASNGGDHNLTAGRMRRRLDDPKYVDGPVLVRVAAESKQGRPWSVIVDETLEFGTVYVHTERQRILLSQETWRVMSADVDNARDFLKSMMGGASGMKFVTGNSGKYGDAARAAAAQRGEDVVVAKDMITTLEELAGALLVQAQGLGGHATSVQVQTFFARLREIEDEYDELAVRLAKLRAYLDLAAMAVVGAADETAA